MAATPKSPWGWVKALLHSIYDQPDAAAVHAQSDRILGNLTEKLPHVAEHVKAARADVLASAERLNREIRRRIPTAPR